MNCLIAAEEQAVGAIKANLEKSGHFPEWDFDAVSGNIFDHSHIGVDVLMLSRFLCNEKPDVFLNRVVAKFAMSQIILLVGKKSEQQKAFIAAAEEIGLTNIVTGKLPGDRPNTIFSVLKKVGDELEKDAEECLVWEDEEQTNAQDTAEISIDRAETSTGITDVENNTQEPGRDIKDKLEDAIVAADNTEAIKTKLQEILSMLDGEDTPGYHMERTLPHQRSILVITAANKGGVGKTTIGITLAVALASNGVKTSLIDYDLGSPNVARYFGIEKGEGIEAIAGKPVRPNLLKDIIQTRHGVDILPGPMTPAMPEFYPGQLLEIVQVLQGIYPIVICDTPSEFWTRPWLRDIFSHAEYVLAIADQSVLSEQDTMAYAPHLISMGVAPEKIGIVLNRFSPQLHSVKKVEKNFCAGFKKGIPRPKVEAVIPEGWVEHGEAGYKGEVTGLDDAHSQYHTLAAKIAQMAGYEYIIKEEKKTKGFFGRTWKK